MTTTKEEQFRLSMVKWLKAEDPDGEFDNFTVGHGVEVATTWSQWALVDCVARGDVPEAVGSFEEVHDHTDANLLGWSVEWDEAQGADLEGEWFVGQFCAFWNAVHVRLDAWIKDGGLRRAVREARRRRPAE